MTDAEPLEEIDEDEAELMIVDPEEYHESQRLREIHQARQKVTKALTEFDPYTIDEEHNRQRGKLAYAVTAYYAELEPLIRASNTESVELRDVLPWDTAGEYATCMGNDPSEGKTVGYEASVLVFRRLNQFLADVKPLIQPEESTEWEV
jgi:hypothetical protein